MLKEPERSARVRRRAYTDYMFERLCTGEGGSRLAEGRDTIRSSDDFVDTKLVRRLPDDSRQAIPGSPCLLNRMCL